MEKYYTKIFESRVPTNLLEPYHSATGGRVNVVPILPNLITSTDETTIFVTPSKIFDKEKVYLVSRPKVIKNEMLDSGKCNDYSTNDIGDAHCRGLRVVLNTTFTAGGLAAPIFVIIYGLTLDEMPKNAIVMVPIPGYTVGGDRHIYSKKEGYIVFVRGKFDVGKENDNSINDCDNNEVELTSDDIEDTTNQDISVSKESRVADLYRTYVYHPFIKDVRVTQYGWSGEGPIPRHLTAVSWMDGAHGQLKRITTEENLKKEEELLITLGKHSAARTGREQSADLGPNFKLVKKGFKTIEAPHECLNPLVSVIKEKLIELEDESNGNLNIVKLKSHKKKALIFALPNMPGATGAAYTIPNVQKALFIMVSLMLKPLQFHP